jgi:1,4-dihydroxy-6-naphthoate synthase
MTKPLSLGFSPCPNDTFIFCGLAHNRIAMPAVSFADPVLEDVETLNNWAMVAKLDVTKLSFHAFGHVQNNYTMLAVGAALGRGCGPLLVTREGAGREYTASWQIAVPGKYTTAALLLKLFLSEHKNVVFMRFDQIMPAVAKGEVDAGVIIHESRFTYKEYGLSCVQDLGEWWEQDTGQPIPLGCIAARTSMGEQKIRAVEQAIAASVTWAHTHHKECLPYIKEHARELDDKVIDGHVGLYVNDFSSDIGSKGRMAVQTLLERGQQAGVFDGAGQGALV